MKKLMIFLFLMMNVNMVFAAEPALGQRDPSPTEGCENINDRRTDAPVVKGSGEEDDKTSVPRDTDL